MFTLLIYFLVAIALSQLWSHSKVMSPLRRFITKIPLARDALLCPPCASFWIALGFSFILNPLAMILPILISNISLAVVNYMFCGILYKHNILTDD
jgi:hypothetical protein